MPITTDNRHAHAVAPNLLDRNLEITIPDMVWLADISYIPIDEGWLYLAAVKDPATMEIVGWSMSVRLKSALCEDALKMAIRNRRPPRGLIHHSDRGVQVCLRRLLQVAQRQWHHSVEEQKGELPGQRPDGTPVSNVNAWTMLF